jgi:hypothetical protein
VWGLVFSERVGGHWSEAECVESGQEEERWRLSLVVRVSWGYGDIFETAWVEEGLGRDLRSTNARFIRHCPLPFDIAEM